MLVYRLLAAVLHLTSSAVAENPVEDLQQLLKSPDNISDGGKLDVNYNVTLQERRTTDKVQDDDELRLVKYLLDVYNKEVRPVKDKNHAVQVVFGMAYTQLLDLDEKNQVLVSNVWIRMIWYNHLLKWDKEDFGGIETINMDPLKVWLPDVVLYNNAEETLGAGQMDLFKTKVIIRYDGENRFYAPTILRSRCGINVEFFPFDDQKCTLKFMSWTYDGYRVNITNKKPEADLSAYLPSGEFELLSADAVRNISYYSCCKEPYPHVTFTLHIRRKTLFYFNNLIVPCFLITALGLLTFVLPPATGERVTLVITTLLAMTVFMLMIAEKTPTTSKVTPLIGKFFIASMVIIGLSLIATCIVLNLYECSRSPETVPRVIRVIVLEYLAPFLRVDAPKEKYISRMSAQHVANNQRRKSNGTISSNNSQLMNGVNNSFNYHQAGQVSRQRNVSTLPKEISEGLSILGERAKQQNKAEALAEEWQAVAKVADRLFLVVFLITIAGTTAYIFTSRPEVPEA